MKLAILSALFFSLAIFAGEIPDINVMSFVNRSNVSRCGPEKETDADRERLGQCQTFLNLSLDNLRKGNFVCAVDAAGKISGLRENSHKLLISTEIAINTAQQELVKAIAQKSRAEQRLDILYLAADVIHSIPKDYKSDAAQNLALAIFSDVIRDGLRQKNYNLVIEAAYKRGYCLYYPKGTSWNSIIAELVKLPQMPKLADLTLIYLEPQWNKGFLASLIGESARPIFEILKKRNWSLPGYEVFFAAYQREGRIYWRVEGIRGPDFYLGFALEQDQIDYCTNDIAGLGTVVIPGVGVDSHWARGLNVYYYTGPDWHKDKEKFLQGPYLRKETNWNKDVLRPFPDLANFFKEKVLPEIIKLDESHKATKELEALQR